MQVPAYETLAALARQSTDFTQHLHSVGSPTEVAAVYHQLVLDSYWKHKDLPMVVTLASAGIHYCFAHAKRASDDGARGNFKSAAKGMAYDLGSFTWPGWDEPGITVTRAQQARGFQAARLNLRLALDLQKPFDKVRHAAWLLGAHHLARGEREAALLQFRYARPDAAEPNYHLFHGYVVLTEMLLQIPHASTAWSALHNELHARSDESARFAREQLQTAHRVFLQ